MGISLADIPIDHAKTVIRAWAWEVFEASSNAYFQNKRWLHKVVRAEKILERDQIKVTLTNGDFVTLERRLS